MSKLMTNPTPGTNKAAEDRLASSCDSQAAQLEDTPSPVDRVSGTWAAPHHLNRDGGGDAVEEEAASAEDFDDPSLASVRRSTAPHGGRPGLVGRERAISQPRSRLTNRPPD